MGVEEKGGRDSNYTPASWLIGASLQEPQWGLQRQDPGGARGLVSLSCEGAMAHRHSAKVVRAIGPQEGTGCVRLGYRYNLGRFQPEGESREAMGQ